MATVAGPSGVVKGGVGGRGRTVSREGPLPSSASPTHCVGALARVGWVREEKADPGPCEGVLL